VLCLHCFPKAWDRRTDKQSTIRDGCIARERERGGKEDSNEIGMKDIWAKKALKMKRRTGSENIMPL